jgi:hypothetical protein
MAVGSAAAGFGDESSQGGGERVDVARFDQLARLAALHELRDRSDVGGDEWQTGCSRLGEHHRETVAEGGKAEHIGGVVPSDQLRAVRGEPTMYVDTGLRFDVGSGHEVEFDLGKFWIVSEASDGFDEQVAPLSS